ncbi:hypothetical protein Taro_003382 [Colocasia esculenta]|uniref:Uncharacterized protein n=1 Tax=Colocasia esculenta TaxID=4460 RepID=A0A843TF80_COLES|nr:hypothetical protein [Colocasia esculenta]
MSGHRYLNTTWASVAITAVGYFLHVVLRLLWLPLQLGAPGSEVSQARGCARGLSRYSGTVRVLSSSWTPSLSRRVVFRLRERWQGPRLFSGAAAGAFVRGCEAER